MSAERVAKHRSAMSKPYIMIMQFDPANAEMIKFGDTYSNSDFSLAEATRDAAAAAEQAASEGRPLQYLVVRTEFVEAFASYEVRG
ncbi:hypothetical protein [Actinoplanes sp. NPDC051411]|uniref:hypothetical protein n=1 Tax=Actinoplanes sp. NPDC051411 TaxID=3155522 RepID=UPI0034409070